MREKKVRGMKRKSNDMIKRIEASTLKFPTEFYNGYWHLHLPVAQGFINSTKTPRKIKRMCIQSLLDSAAHLTELKPKDNEKYRVMVSIELPDLWDSQLIVFQGDTHFDDFFNRNDDYQKWLPLPENRKIHTEWGLSIPNGMQIAGFHQLILDEEYPYENDIWFIGELT